MILGCVPRQRCSRFEHFRAIFKCALVTSMLGQFSLSLAFEVAHLAFEFPEKPLLKQELDTGTHL
jgi:hypothetical protein